MKKSLAVVTVVALLGFAGSASAAAALDGAKLLEERCSGCHSSALSKSAKKSKAEWDKTVSRMMSKGAKLSAPEKKALVNHLAKTYKP